jgi:hypothetical protein
MYAVAIVLGNYLWRTFDVMSPRHCGVNEMKLR